jgi:ABC-type sugar transport system, periplasmic component
MNKKVGAFLLVCVLFVSIVGVSIFAAPKTEKLTIWAMGMEGQTLGKMIPGFEAANPGIKVELQELSWGVVHERLITGIAGSVVPDLAQMGTTWMSEFAASGGLEEVSGYFESSKLIKPSDFFPASLETCKYNGKLWGIPWYADTRIIFYRTDILAKAGYKEFPETWDQFLDCLRILRDRGPNMYGIYLDPANWQETLNFVWQNDGRILNAAGKPAVTSPAFVEAMNWVGNLYTQEKVATVDSGGTSKHQDLNSGRMPIFIGGPWEMNQIHSEYPNLDGKWSIAMMPKKKNRNSFIGGGNLVMFKAARHKKAAWKFVEFFSQPANQLKWYKMAGSLPAVKKVWETAYMKADPQKQILYQQLQNGQAPDNSPYWEQIAIKINPRMQEVCYGVKSAAKAAKELNEDIILLMK